MRNPAHPASRPASVYGNKCSGGRWLFFACDDPETASAGILIGASTTSDPTGTWFLHKVDVDSTDTLWADFPSVGFNKDWVVFQVNMFTDCVNCETFDHGAIYAFSKASLYAGAARSRSSPRMPTHSWPRPPSPSTPAWPRCT